MGLVFVKLAVIMTRVMLIVGVGYMCGVEGLCQTAPR